MLFLNQRIATMRYLYLYLYFILPFALFSQSKSLNIIGKDKHETDIINNFDYKKSFSNEEQAEKEINLLVDKLKHQGYFWVEITDKKQTAKSFDITLSLGQKVNEFILKIPKEWTSIINEKEEKKISTNQLDAYLSQILNVLDKKGYSLAKVSLANIFTKKEIAYADILITSEEKKREVNDIVINGYTKFPKSYKKQLQKSFKKNLFSQEQLQTFNKNLNTIRFVKQIKNPEVLFTKDSTKIYVYIEKVKANSFDGLIGFSNSESQKINFNGYLDINLANILNSGEQSHIYWKSNGNQQKTFQLDFEIPYIFNTPVLTKFGLSIVKQDSTFQNSKTYIHFGHQFNANTKVYLGYQKQESSDIRNQNSTLINDYIAHFYTAEYSFIQYQNYAILFPEKAIFTAKIGTGTRNSKFNTNQQYFIDVSASYNYAINSKNNLYIKNSIQHLKSNQYLTNELYRFGGVNNFRGFGENILQGNTFIALLSEYRYLLSNNLYIHSVLDIGYLQDKTLNLNRKLWSSGIGLGIRTQSGLLNVIYANGNTDNQTFNFKNSIFQISFKNTF